MDWNSDGNVMWTVYLELKVNCKRYTRKEKLLLVFTVSCLERTWTLTVWLCRESCQNHRRLTIRTIWSYPLIILRFWKQLFGSTSKQSSWFFMSCVVQQYLWMSRELNWLIGYCVQIENWCKHDKQEHNVKSETTDPKHICSVELASKQVSLDLEPRHPNYFNCTVLKELCVLYMHYQPIPLLVKCNFNCCQFWGKGRKCFWNENETWETSLYPLQDHFCEKDMGPTLIL